MLLPHSEEYGAHTPSASGQSGEPLPIQGKRRERARAYPQPHTTTDWYATTQIVISVGQAVLTAIHPLTKYWAPSLASRSAKDWGHWEDGPSSISTYSKMSRHGIPGSLGWETGLLCWFHGMTETVFKEAEPWLHGNCFWLSNFTEPACSLYFLFLFSSDARRQALRNC